MNDHRGYIRNLAVAKGKPEKILGLNGIWTHDLCDTGAVLYQIHIMTSSQLAW